MEQGPREQATIRKGTASSESREQQQQQRQTMAVFLGSLAASLRVNLARLRTLSDVSAPIVPFPSLLSNSLTQAICTCLQRILSIEQSIGQHSHAASSLAERMLCAQIKASGSPEQSAALDPWPSGPTGRHGQSFDSASFKFNRNVAIDHA